MNTFLQALLQKAVPEDIRFIMRIFPFLLVAPAGPAYKTYL